MLLPRTQHVDGREIDAGCITAAHRSLTVMVFVQYAKPSAGEIMKHTLVTLPTTCGVPWWCEVDGGCSLRSLPGSWTKAHIHGVYRCPCPMVRSCPVGQNFRSQSCLC